MGCTSSAPKMAESNNSDNLNDNMNLETSDETKKEELTSNDRDIKKNEIVLPMCDNLVENIQLSRNNSSVNVPNQQVEKVDHIRNGEKQFENPELIIDQQNQNEFPLFKKVVNQAMLENIFQSAENISTVAVKEISSDENIKNEENIIESQEICNNEDFIENNEQEEILEEAVSPSQSECSHATRWEALADIAAELPASHAVDPLTGQIYSLAK
ncbi:unnamed protein product [Euphydryas editha]|uniref:Uncharacterized protein n=1 Tax=Euphydryas editha TaxID=104508 RepID=A0AAU9TZA7_EUPED|nr:unnamed protein product [Euphydryas editha]